MARSGHAGVGGSGACATLVAHRVGGSEVVGLWRLFIGEQGKRVGHIGGRHHNLDAAEAGGLLPWVFVLKKK